MSRPFSLVILAVLALTAPADAFKSQMNFRSSSNATSATEAFASVLQHLRQAHAFIQQKLPDPVTMIAAQLKNKVHSGSDIYQQPDVVVPVGPDGQPVPAGPTTGQIILNMIMTALIFLVSAKIYTKYKPVFVTQDSLSGTKDSLNGDFKHGLCSWYETPSLALCGLCCGGIRWADTMRMAGFLCFAYGLCIWLAIETLSGLIGVLSWIALVVVGTMYRQKLRESFNMETGGSTILWDCLTWGCCGCCAVVQEARQIEEAKLMGHDAVKEKELDFSIS